MACNSMYQMALSLQLTLFPPTYFDLVMADGVGVKLTPSYFFEDSQRRFIDLKLGTYTK